MWSYEKNATANVSRAIVWEWWTAVEKWPQWDTDLSEAALLGELAVGVQGKMKVADDALITFVVAELVPEERLVIVVRFFGAQLSYVYSMIEEDGQLRITHGAHISGVLGFLWRFFISKKIEKTIQPGLEALVAQVIAESARRAEIAAAAATPSSLSDTPVETADQQDTVQAPDNRGDQVVSAGGDPVENELRSKDIHTQIEAAAQAPDVIITPPVDSTAHTSVIAVSPVVTKKETKRVK